jgi:hypothetical protein
MEALYHDVDWKEISAADHEFIVIQGVKVPYVVFENEDDVTTRRGEALSERLGKALGKLWNLYNH